jgi:hypothetical protein
MEYAGDVVVVFDPSKSNMAMVVGTPDGTILNTIEFSGNNRKRGPAMDTTIYCEEVRQFLSIYLSKVKLYMVATEQAITKTGTAYHHSNMVLTEIRGTILSFFLDHFGVRVIEVNNWSWKFAILPEGYRGKFEKGSKKWFQNCMPESPYTYYFEADMTDCICIYWYLIKKHCANYSCYCNQYEKCETDYMYYFLAESNNATSDMREVTYNPRFSVEENLGFYVNRIVGNFFMIVPVEKIDVADMYGKSVGFQLCDTDCVNIKVVARRT